LPDPALPSRDAVRSWFPSLGSGFAFLENAGGSQVPGCVADAIREYMLSTYVQLGAGYPLSVRATALVEEAHAFVETLMNAGAVGRVALGPSTTALSTILAHAYGEVLRPGDEVILAETNHEANAGPWARLARRGVTVKWWPVDRATTACSLDRLADLLTDRTRIVALPHVSNLLGEIEDVRAATELAHARRARVVVDGVAFAPHRAIDVQALGVDYYLYSTYKVFGPHMAAMFGRHEAFAEIEGPNHFFVPKESIPYKFELGGVQHELCAGILALGQYLAFLAGAQVCDRAAVERAFAAMAALEQPLVERLLGWLAARPSVRVVGSPRADAQRVGTVSFAHERVPSAAIAAAAHREGIGIRNGHMYAPRLCRALGIDEADGAVRVSLVHYNTPEEIERLIAALDRFI
jgi:cysteine desulfurase family protein (TIGR01976 family)